jgi:cytochrome c biogenesis protein|tara:strand:- start:990 stop:2888 length:1899 start_codon:yes stop_codon:yes gene_type:complete
MRFAITMFSFVAIASIIGTILKQNEPYESYLIKLGQFWFEIFEILGLYNVYQAFWFLLILIFLIISTSLCVYRNTPKIISDYRKFQDKVQEKSLLTFKHSYKLAYQKLDNNKLESFLLKNKFRFKKKKLSNGDELFSAKKGEFQKLGYIFTHLAIIVISIGGLFDGNLVFKVQESLGIKNIIIDDIPLKEIPSSSRLSESNFSYRAQMLLAEGEKQEVAVLRAKEGYLIQELPFSVALKDFRIKHYSTGQPKSFESDLLVEDKKTGKITTKTISVNKPLTVDGITIYQSDFQDGGSKLDLKIWDLHSNQSFVPMASEIFKKNKLVYNNQNFSVEFNDFRQFNILEIEDGKKKKLRNVGPNFIYKIRSESGQAIEYQTYQFPMLVGGTSFFMSGMRTTPQDEFRYIKIPADANGELKGFLKFRSLITSPKVLSESIDKVIQETSSGKNIDSNLFKASFLKVTKGFLGGGYNQVANLIDQEGITSLKQEDIATSYIKIIFLVSNEIIKNYKLKNKNDDSFLFDDSSLFIQNALNAYSDSFFYGIPMFFELNDYEHIQASGLQLTKSPGQAWVYIGSIMLVLGIFCMIYIQDVRLWILKYKKTKKIVISMTTNRQHYEFDKLALEIRDKIKSIIK